MKLRVRINKQTYRVELEEGADGASLTELTIRIREVLLPSQGLSPDTEFTLSLNGKEPLSDTGQTLSSAGLVSGDLVCVILPPSLAPAPGSAPPASGACHADPPRQQLTCATALHETQPGPSRSTTTTTTTTTTTPPTTSSRPDRMDEGPAEPAAEGGAGPMGPLCTQEPMLCSEAEDGQAPLSLELLHRGVRGGGGGGPCDLVLVAAHVLMLETGFMPQDSGLRAGDMPVGWRSAGGAYKLQYTHPLCENSLIMVIGLSMGPVLVINATLKVNEKVDAVRKLCLDPSTYVTDVESAEAGAAAVYKALAKLSRTFKDQLAYPLIAAARAAMALPPAFGLCVLPPELLLRVLRLLDAPALVALSAASRRLRGVAEDSTLWRHLYVRDFRGQSPSSSTETDWKDLYKRKYQTRKHYRQAAARPPHWLPPPPLYPVVPGSNPFHPQPFAPYPPGIIGGDYDQRPDFPLGMLPRPRFDPLGPFSGGLGGPPGINPPGVGPSRRRGGPGPIRDIRRGFI
ncbi:F-box only protein 7 [Gadus morhua]|uniref:F-box domain-containing protein n=1 Tax=Gadus morhua TaxID=8049 RepID=A0A8C4YUX5_GADMO|nr:F-box only protein 7 [Gadus morhua]